MCISFVIRILSINNGEFDVCDSEGLGWADGCLGRDRWIEVMVKLDG